MPSDRQLEFRHFETWEDLGRLLPKRAGLASWNTTSSEDQLLWTIRTAASFDDVEIACQQAVDKRVPWILLSPSGRMRHVGWPEDEIPEIRKGFKAFIDRAETLSNR